MAQFTHEQYVQRVARIATTRKALSPDQRAKLGAIKLCYGAGQAGLRGVTYYDRWGKPDGKVPFVEVCAFGQESLVQLAGTTIHELGHVLAGWSAGHGKEWKDACALLGLSGVQAAGTAYTWDMFARDIQGRIKALPKPTDGEPAVSLVHGPGLGPKAAGKPARSQGAALKPCGAGKGTKGGTSYSATRLKLWECECRPPMKVRCARELHALCTDCNGAFICQSA